ncbi:hypothetical protein D3C85_1767540 [compost metagenome]
MRRGSKQADDLFARVVNEVLDEFGFDTDSIWTESMGNNKEWFLRDEESIYFYL